MSEIKTSNITENKMFKLLTEANATIRKLEIKLDKLMDTNIQLMESNQEKDQTIASLSAQVADLTEQLLISNQSNQDIKEQLQSMNHRLFGRKSEKRSKPGSSADHNTNKEDDDDDDENNDHLSSASSSSSPDFVLPALEDNLVQPKRLRRKKSSSRKKKRAMQKMIEDYDLKPEVVIHTLKEDERRCSKCGTTLK